MNATINKIVDLLFEDLMESEETRTIREEILQNCQERYQDLREAGISEDDAIHAVIESLNGMEEMLSEYPRKADEPVNVPQTPEAEVAEAVEEEENEETRTWSCDPVQSPISKIRMEHMGSAAVIVRTSHDHQIHVECSNPKLTLMTGMENKVLSIALSDHQPEVIKEEIKFSLQDGFDLSSLGRMFEKLAKRIKNNLSGTEITLEIPDALCPELYIGTTCGEVTVDPIKLERLRIGTASGDTEVDRAIIHSELRITSASGDITITGAEAQQLQVSTASGDIEASDGSILENVKLNTTSGDINWRTQCRTLEANSVSGDITLEGSVENLKFHTVSGDVDVRLNNMHLLAINGNTTSGDIDVSLPSELEVDLHLNAVSSHISSHANCVPGAPVIVKLSTVSGNLTVK